MWTRRRIGKRIRRSSSSRRTVRGGRARPPSGSGVQSRARHSERATFTRSASITRARQRESEKGRGASSKRSRSQSARARSKSYPPIPSLPTLSSTCHTPSPLSTTERSTVPAPKSKTRKRPSRPKESAAAVGSATIRASCSPAASAARTMASLWVREKQAGTARTQEETKTPRCASASSLRAESSGTSKSCAA